MKQRNNRLLWILAALILALPAASLTAAPRGYFGHGGGRIIVRGGFGPYWGWGWPYWSYGYGYRYSEAAYGPISNWAAVKTDVAPEEARVYLDGRYIGTADDFDGWPDKLYLRPGRYKLEFRLNGYQPVVIQVDARRGQTLDVDNHLQKGGAGVSTKADPPKMSGNVQRFFGKRRDGQPARAYVPDRDTDGSSASMGTSSMGTSSSSSDAAGSSDEDGPTADAERDRDDARDRDRPPARTDDASHNNAMRSMSGRSPRAERSRLVIRVEPADAAVYVDDRFVGTADELASMDKGIVVTPGKHTVTVSRPGYRDNSSDVDVAAGRSETVEVELEK